MSTKSVRSKSKVKNVKKRSANNTFVCLPNYLYRQYLSQIKMSVNVE